jgi:hypothetical protein
MAISRAQLLKELLPGLNALFGLEYQKYGEEHKEIFDQESSERSFEEEVKLSGFSAAPVKDEGVLDTTMRQLLLDFQLQKKLWKIICMTAYQADTLKLLLELWRTQSKLKLLQFLTMVSIVATLVVMALSYSLQLTHLFLVVQTQTSLQLTLT